MNEPVLVAVPSVVATLIFTVPVALAGTTAMIMVDVALVTSWRDGLDHRLET